MYAKDEQEDATDDSRSRQPKPTLTGVSINKVRDAIRFSRPFRLEIITGKIKFTLTENWKYEVLLRSLGLRSCWIRRSIADGYSFNYAFAYESNYLELSVGTKENVTDPRVHGVLKTRKSR